jgi:protein O-mannosyl-transferase
VSRPRARRAAAAPDPAPSALAGVGRGRAVAIAAVLFAATLAVYAPVRHHGFVNFDDPLYVTDNPMVADGLSRRGLSRAFTTSHAGNWHPLTWLSHMLDVEVHGLRPGGHHVTSVILHAASAVLLFAFFVRTTGALGRSAFVAGLFALHPLHVESVAWVSERKDVLSGLFFFLTLLAYAAYARAPSLGRYAAVAALYAAGLMAKPMLVTLPFVLLLLDHWPLGRAAPRSAWPALVREKVPLFVLAAASSLVTLAVQQQAGAVKALDVLPLGRRLANAALASIEYVRMAVWPARLAVLYPYPPPASVAAVVAAVVVLAAVTALTVRSRRRHPWLAVGWSWYVVMLVPVIGIVQVGSQPYADRYTYLPLVGLFVVLAWGVPALWTAGPYREALPVTSAVVVLAVGAAATRAQLAHWRTSVALWRHAVEVAPPNARAEANLGHALAGEGQTGEAIVHYEAALRLDPSVSEAHNNLGLALVDEGRVEDAIAHYAEALRLRPDYAEAHGNLGAALLREGRSEEAARHLARAVALAPGLAAAHNNLGAAQARLGRFDEAIGSFEEALRLRPGYEEARGNLALAHNARGAALADRGRPQDAIAAYQEALRVRPDLADARVNLAHALAGQGKGDEALREILEAARLLPGDADVHYDAAVLLAGQGRTAEAAAHLETALRLDPGHAAARRAREALATDQRQSPWRTKPAQ